MRERELLRVQKMAIEVAHVRAESRVLNRVVASGAVRLITDDRISQPREVNADLMRASGFQLNVEQREAIETLPHAIQRKRAASATHDGHARAVFGIASEWLIDGARISVHAPVHQRDVRLEHRTIAKLI